MYDLFYAIAFSGSLLYEYGQQVGAIGNTIEEEHQYLRNVSNAGPYKKYYLNIISILMVRDLKKLFSGTGC